MNDLPYLSGGEQTTINSTITELFPALAFNSGVHPKNANDMETFIKELTLTENGAKKSFVNNSNIESAKEYITQMSRIRPAMKKTKLENAVGILNWIMNIISKEK